MITLNRKQAEKFVKLVNHFKEVEWFTIEEDNSNGLGPALQVRFNLFKDDDKDDDVQVDITDVSTW
jgi:hypothetical protein